MRLFHIPTAAHLYDPALTVNDTLRRVRAVSRAAASSAATESGCTGEILFGFHLG